MTTDQERTIDALSLFHGGWAATEPVEYAPALIRVKTAGDQENYIVHTDGSAEVHTPWDQLGTLTTEQVQMAVYGQEV